MDKINLPSLSGQDRHRLIFYNIGMLYAKMGDKKRRKDVYLFFVIGART